MLCRMQSLAGTDRCQSHFTLQLPPHTVAKPLKVVHIECAPRAKKKEKPVKICGSCMKTKRAHSVRTRAKG